MQIEVLTDILAANDATAAETRGRCDENGVLVVNLMSSPGSGKTTLLERTIGELGGRYRIAVIEGDIATDRDAQRLAAFDIPVVQINTGSHCHLNAAMVGGALDRLDLARIDLLFIENVGNLVCPAEFDVGEHFKVMLLSVTEGDEKPLKYPAMFRVCSALVINKLDLLPYTNFDIATATKNALSINPKLVVLPLSCTNDQGFVGWLSFIKRSIGRKE